MCIMKLAIVYFSRSKRTGSLRLRWPGTSRRKKRMRLLSGWFLYDKSSFEFKNCHKKERAWLEMDQKMRLNPGDLYRWYTSLRTQYVKEVKKKENATRSGAGAVNDIMMPRITWLLEKFEFIKQYVCQARATRGSNIQRPNKHSDCSDTPS